MNNQLFRFIKSSPLSYVLSLFILLVLIEILCHLFNLPLYILPPPTIVIPYLLKNLAAFSKDLVFTFREIFIGFIVGWGVAFILATGAIFFPLLRSFVRPVIVLSQTIPVLAIAPLLILWFGYGILSKIATSALLVLFPVFVGVTDGFLSVPPRFLDFMKASRATRLQIFWLIQLPQAVPNIITATKIGITLAVIGAIIGEFITAEHGIGLIIRQSVTQMNTILTFSMLYILGLSGVILYSFLDILELILQKKYQKIE